ncbi:MAG: DUF6364 family protein [Bacteroidetes bacterium]|nr:DUF6364 family protein [Bacteroidota bacterium]MDA1122194.1 DUF6364 family protein [Bacteroidota bacterium]
MNTKLTLKLDKAVIDKAKEYAQSQKISLSRLIESYLASPISKQNKDMEISPLVESLSGVIKLDKDFDYKKEYNDFLKEKYN